ncbi:hypothetical protein BGZ50_009168 [Haplosporangium sp. Z 11]|nr:hypothetical protein BGZ50_009168 [Haplosporangium sp. Z 11]
MGSASDAFDTLCQQVFLISNDTTSMNDTSTNNAMPSAEESALSLVSRAQVYELPLSYTQLPSGSESTPSLEKQDRKFYRIHLETIEDPVLQQTIHSILVQAIDPAVLLVLPFDRNLSGYSTKTRAEAREAALDAPVILDMEGISSTEDQTSNSAMNDHNGSEDIDNKTMLLLPTKEWLRMNARIRYWRAESHRVKAAQREVALDGLLYERWKPATSLSPLSYSNLPPLSSSISISSPPPTSGSLVTATIPPASFSSPPQPVISSTASSPASSPLSPTAPQTTMPPTRPSHCKQPFQEHQLESLVQFMVQYGGEPSAASILRGVLELIQRQLTETKVLSWTFDRANLTEQKPEVTVAFLDLVARLGLEMVETDMKQQQRKQEDSISSTQQPLVTPASLVDTKSSSSSASQTTAVDSFAIASSTELTWTFGSKIDDRRLEYWIHHLLQSSLPVLKMDDNSLLPSSATFTDSTSNTSISMHDGAHQRSNPIPLDIRKRFLKERHTISAGTIQVLTNAAGLSSTYPVLRDRAFVLSTSKYAMSGPPGDGTSGVSSSGLFVQRVKRDVKDLARWASTCGGRLDWIWAWLFSSFQRSRRGPSDSGAGSTARRPRPNDENV